MLSISAILLFAYTSFLLNDEIEEELYSNKDRVEKLLEQNPSIRGIPPIMMVEPVEEAMALTLKDTMIFDPLQDEVELFRELSETKEINGQYYRITIRTMVIESEDILFTIVFTFIAVILLAFLFLFYLNKSRNEKLWKPFFESLEKLKAFSLRSNTPLIFDNTEISEFHELNTQMETLTAKVQTDYRNLKQFTEDVSHEMQTPLAIMQAKIETLINAPEVVESQFDKLTSLQDDIRRLKQLNRQLILLAKIDNDQFSEPDEIVINKVFEKGIQNFKEFSSKDIESETNALIKVKMDILLASVLCSNLLSNAIRHSNTNNPIQVRFQDKSVEVINAGEKALTKPELIFERFYKEGQREESTGLGLSIVKKICDYYDFKPSYSFSDGHHIFKVTFG